jgi:hypothetical protein
MRGQRTQLWRRSLGETLEEEKAADEKVTQIAKSRINRQALIDAGSEEELVSHQASSQAAGRTKKR